MVKGLRIKGLRLKFGLVAIAVMAAWAAVLFIVELTYPAWRLPALITLVLFSLYAAMFSISRWVLRPLEALDKMLKNILSGEADLSAQINLIRDDEIGETAKSLNTLFDRLRQLVRGAQEISIDLLGLTEVMRVKTQAFRESSNEQRE
ncbi:MAG: methyl-accepting chemotaxis protein, partial [Nitrospirota bacterium]